MKIKQMEILEVKMIFEVDKINSTLYVKRDSVNWKILVRKPPRIELIKV